MGAGQSNLWLGQPWNPTAQGGPAGGGGGTPEVFANPRDYLDAARGANGSGRLGEAEYPDGYLEPGRTDRRAERMSSEVMGRLTDRHYQRGVHAGSKQPVQSYFWPEEWNMDTGLERMAMGTPQPEGTYAVARNTLVGDPVQILMHGGQMGDVQDKIGVMKRFGVDPDHPKFGLDDNPAAIRTMYGDLPPWSW